MVPREVLPFEVKVRACNVTRRASKPDDATFEGELKEVSDVGFVIHDENPGHVSTVPVSDRIGSHKDYDGASAR